MNIIELSIEILADIFFSIFLVNCRKFCLVCQVWNSPLDAAISQCFLIFLNLLRP